MAEYTSTTSQPAWVQPYAQGYMQQAQQVANMPYQAYGGDRVAGFTPWQQQGYGAMAQRAADGSPLMGTAQQTLQQMFSTQGQGATANPYGPVQAGQNDTMVQSGPGGAPVDAGWNDMQIRAPDPTAPIRPDTNNTMQVTPGQNQYASLDNPFIASQIDQAQGDVVRNWNQIQMPGFDTAMSRSGSFGNANIKSMASQGVSDLQKNLGDISSKMRFQDYSQQQQLAENAVNRGMQAQQFNSGLQENNLNRGMGLAQFNAGLNESAAGRSMQAQQFNSGLNSENLGRRMQAGQFNAGLGEAAAGRNMQAQQFNSGTQDNNLIRQMQAQQFNGQMGESFAGRNDQMYGNNQNRLMQALGMAPSFAQQDYNDIDRLVQAGGAYQGQNQQGLNDAYQRFQESRAYPQQQLDVMGRALGSFNPGSTTTQQQPGASSFAQGLGGALTFAQLMRLIGG